MSETAPAEALTRYIPLHPKPIKVLYELQKTIHPHYRIDSTLVFAKTGATKNEDFSKPSLELGGCSRSPELEAAEITDPASGQLIHPREIADENFQEMERATALKWYIVLNKLFSAEHFRKLPIHSPDGRLKIAIPGCRLGFEIGGILDFFNEQGIPIDIDAVDIEDAGAERQFMKLEDREKVKGSKVNFMSKTDAREFYKGKRYDVVLLRHPGFVFEPDQYYVWREIIDVMAQTKPGIMIFSTYNHKLENDPLYIKEVLGFNDKEVVYEAEVLERLLGNNGYHTTDDYCSVVADERLKYPLNPYMVAFNKVNDQLKWTVPVDREIQIFGNQEYLSQSV